MNRFRKTLIALVTAAIVTLPAVGASGGAALAQAPAPAVMFDGAPVAVAGDAASIPSLAGLADDAPLSLFVRLEGPSVMDIAAAAGGMDGLDVRTRRQLYELVGERQLGTVQSLQGLGATIVGTFQTTVNMIHVNTVRGQLESILALPGVVRVSRAPEHEPAMDDSRPHIGATRVADELGWDGQGTTIAIIDTGIDYMHVAFAGSGDVEARADDDPTDPDDNGFPTEKVIGGYDFVGEFYNAGCASAACTTEPTPDDDPIDDGSHGTHVAGIAAAFEAGDVPAGVAPGATLVALKVFGASGSTNVTAEAIDWVATHNMLLGDPGIDELPGIHPDVKIDVINMSLGSGYGPASFEYDEVVAKTLEHGTTIVASAGNSGASPYIVGTPSAHEGILSVANSYAPGEEGQLVEADWTDDTGPVHEGYAAFEAAGGWAATMDEYTDPISAPLAWYGSGCDGAPDEPFQDVSEKIALLERGVCPFYDKARNALANGAIAAVMFSDPRPPVPMGCGAPSPCATKIEIPAVLMEREPGVALKDLVFTDGVEVIVTLRPGARAVFESFADAMADSSSRGPARFSGMIKPQITAPGSNILAPLSGSGSGAVRFSGTSMSGPAVAGVTALLWQRNRVEELDLDPSQIAALAMNYANPVIHRGTNTGPLEGVTMQGAGLVQAFDSATGDTVVRSDHGIAELSYRQVHFTDVVEPQEIALHVSNVGDEDKTYATDFVFSFPEEDGDVGIDVSIEPETFTVEAGDTAVISATLVVEPSETRPWFEPTFQPIIDENRFRTYEVDGYVHLTEVDGDGEAVEGGDVVGVPFHSIPRHHGCIVMDSDDAFALAGEEPMLEVSWENECGATAYLEPSILLGTEPLESETNDDYPAELDGGAVGLRWGVIESDTAPPLETFSFVVGTAGKREIAFDAQFWIYFDTDLDGEFDRIAFTLNGTPVGRHPTEFLTFYGDVDPETLSPTGTISASFFVIWDLDDSAMTLTMPVEALGEGATFTDETLAFDFAVRITDGVGDYAVTDDFLGYDNMPDDFEEADGGRYSYDNAVMSCLAFETAGADPESVLSPNLIWNMPTGSRVNAELAWTCDEPPASSVQTGILSRYINNMPGVGTGWSVREGVIGMYSIFMPKLDRNYELPVPDAPTEEPTEEPGPAPDPTDEP